MTSTRAWHDLSMSSIPPSSRLFFLSATGNCGQLARGEEKVGHYCATLTGNRPGARITEAWEQKGPLSLFYSLSPGIDPGRGTVGGGLIITV